VEINERTVGPVTVLDLSGKLTLGHSDERVLAEVVRVLESGAARVLINLDQVPYMDSAGMGALVTCGKRAVERGAALKLLNPSKRVYDLLTLVKLDRVFEMFHDETAAVASFGEEAL